MELTQWILGKEDGLLVLEPMTALTDFIVTAVCIPIYQFSIFISH